ncbi:hypothetical protein F4553_002005 [Allocatelliglobosispora scoriae]|uniref:Uncharacterized protein n=1 Tax=Allocatelliglobosispora scoriae TaxID=643052 RepID=A0A841BMX4_9ACTN|nr:hypothetical protein [Allocatelliglobosispora scoriae]MBB5868626.1 hypothetical protein [Allocatelliglobosispora scoriae]
MPDDHDDYPARRLEYLTGLIVKRGGGSYRHLHRMLGTSNILTADAEDQYEVMEYAHRWAARLRKTRS